MTPRTEPCKIGNWFGKPYFHFSDYLRDTYRCRVLKLPINANLSCPNRGAMNSGCIFCSEDGSASPGIGGRTSIPEQMESARKNFKRIDAGTRFIAYFQAYTNTYAPPAQLKRLYDQAVRQRDVIGLMIGTRPDCLPDQTLDLIASYQKDGFELWLEIGMQTIHDKSLEFLRRGHSSSATMNAVERAVRKNIPVCVHLILGITGEDWKEMMDTADALSQMPVRGVKFHHLHVIQGTQLEKLFRAGEVKPLSQREYVSILCDFIERLPSSILIHRLMGDREESTLVAPRWSLNKGTVIKAIEDEFARRGTFQGFLYNEGRGSIDG
ncbi:MAG: TIGR01212 family radical SAM protein [Spirochaetes bacterium RBG_16_49_21]|nr:MAG: TIGR01212 family radical SAM protein [Spirochaetes bacterium RBG_16_49_21]